MASTQGDRSGSTGPSRAPKHKHCDFCPFGASRKQFISDYWSFQYQAMKRSADRCQACAGIVSFLNAQNLEPTTLRYKLDMTVDMKFTSESDTHTYELFVKDERPAWEGRLGPGLRLDCGLIPRLRVPSNNTSSTSAFGTLENWIFRCKKEHSKCRPKAERTLPRRVLEIKSIEPLRVRLVENCSQKADYACLSHRWGPGTKSNSLNKENLDIYKAEVPEDKFYPLVRDAIVSIFRLGIQFVWIDCYCIVQDDLGDWQVEAANMARIYEDAFFTISATFSEEGRRMFLPMTVEFKEFQVTRITGEDVYIRRRLPHPCDVQGGEQLSGPSLTRAWVFQERMLSNRFIHFTRGEIFWECRECTWCECRSREGEWAQWRMKVSRTIESQEWDLIAAQYNDTNLSFSKDRLAALAGVARPYAEIRGLEYLSGLWKENLPSALAWLKFECNEERPLERFAPTWSWTSLPRGSLHFTGPVRGSVRLVGYEIYPTGADIYTGAMWTEITVEGPTLDMAVYKESDEVLIGKHKDVFLKLGPDFKTDPDDEKKDRAVRNGSSCLLLLLAENLKRHGTYNVFGIVLLPRNGSLDGEGAKYERIGYIGNDGFDDSYQDTSDDYAEYCGGSFPHGQITSIH